MLNLTKKEIHNITVIDKNKKFLDKGFGHYYYRGLIFFFVILILFSIPLIRGDASGLDYLFLFIVLFLFYSMIMGMLWGFVSLSAWSGKRYIKKMNISRKEYEEIIHEHGKDGLTEMYEQLTKRYQVESLHKMPEFRVPENPVIYEKVGRWLGWDEVDKSQNRKKSKSDSLAIYKTLLHYWNKRFFQVHYTTKRTKNTSFGRKHVFDSVEGDKVTIENYYEAPHPVNDDLLFDTISYVYKQKKNVYDERKSNIGILWNLQMPDVKEFNSDISNNFYIAPAGKQSKVDFYNYHVTRGGYDVYITGDVLNRELDKVLELISPFTERDWELGVEYTGSYMYIYLPEFLPDIENITSESELLHVCRRVDSFYSFFKRSLVWRYGEIEMWNKGEPND